MRHKRFDKLHTVAYYDSDMPETPRLILASTSPRRRELVMRLGLPFELIAVDVDESASMHESPEDMVRRLSRAKAEQAVGAHPDAIIVAADTIGAIDDTILGKPQDADDAARMLRQLRGRAHIVYSGVVVARGERSVQQIATTTVWMRDYSDAEIAAYVATGDPLDKAASYAIQHPIFQPVARIDGCYANVMGLPLCRVYLGIKEFGVVAPDAPRVFASYLEDNCPVAKQLTVNSQP